MFIGLIAGLLTIVAMYYEIYTRIKKRLLNKHPSKPCGQPFT
jgi:hypothetical protein